MKLPVDFRTLVYQPLTMTDANARLTEKQQRLKRKNGNWDDIIPYGVEHDKKHRHDDLNSEEERSD
ncbi:hypothetical protein HDV02_001340 [Globomyces sp. JEL0801]|nr:hypothetical protein HDV02_001340 [Globomyces sp. JEL0801]